MKYFAKYLPVEREIKEGYCIDTKNNKIVYYNGDYGEKRPDYLKPTKLFLCSRDIQVGDKVWAEDTSKHNLKLNDFGIVLSLEFGGIKVRPQTLSQEYIRYGKDEVIKVIGEISSKAIWVKENDEFDENEIKISDYPKCPKCGAISNDGFCPEDIDCKINDKQYVIYIKGSCGHFH
jgi:hypothetical protein